MNTHNQSPFVQKEPSDILGISRNLSGIFSHANAEALLKRIVQVVEDHEVAVKNLTRNQEECRDAIERLHQQITRVQVDVDSTNHKLESIEKAIFIENSKSTIGECVLANRKSVVNAFNLISCKMDTEEVETSLEEMKKQLKRDFASNEAMQKSNETIKSLVSRLEVVAEECKSKVDKTLFKALSSEAATLQNYADFVENTESSIKQIKENMERFENTQDDLSRQTDVITETMDTLSPKEALKNVERSIQELSNSINEKLDAGFDSLGDKVLTLEEDTKTLFTSHETLAKHFTQRFDKVYNKDAIDEKVSDRVERNHFDQTLHSMKQEIDEKTENVSSLVQTMKKELEVTQKKAELAAQFVSLYEEENEYSDDTESSR